MRPIRTAAASAREIAKLPQRRIETLLEAALPGADGRRRLLLDCRGLTELHNGTTVCILGFLDGFAALDAGWDIDVLASAEASSASRPAATISSLRSSQRLRARQLCGGGPARPAVGHRTSRRAASAGPRDRVSHARRHLRGTSTRAAPTSRRPGISSRATPTASCTSPTSRASASTGDFPYPSSTAEAVTHLSLAPEDYLPVGGAVRPDPPSNPGLRQPSRPQARPADRAIAGGCLPVSRHHGASASRTPRGTT